MSSLVQDVVSLSSRDEVSLSSRYALQDPTLRGGRRRVAPRRRTVRVPEEQDMARRPRGVVSGGGRQERGWGLRVVATRGVGRLL
jgi:hypothetical protein